MPYLELLGPPAFNDANGRVMLRAELPTFLLAWLASRDGWVDRGETAAMFWPDETESSARHNLSQLLYRSRKLPWHRFIEAEPSRLRFAGSSDLALLQHALAAGDWSTASETYKGQFLGTMTGPDNAGWSDWLAAERENLLATWTEAASNRAAELQAQENHQEAAGLLKAVLQQDPLAETVLQEYLRAAGLAGQRSQALAAYREFSALLQRELGMEPLQDTQDLAEQLQAAASPRERSAGGGLLGAPAQLSSFVARELELAQLSGELQKDEVRLVTIVGPGGIGKTRLALQAGQTLAEQFDQAVLVPLASLADGTNLYLQAASALGLSLGGNAEPEAQLLDYLRDRSVLLLVDNFEHVLPAAPLLGRLLQRAPLLKTLVTSREALGLSGEILLELEGLALPATADDPQFQDYGAVQMFLRSARRLHPGLQLQAADRGHLLDILRLLDGLPLGIELAVPWLRLLPLDELAAELESNLGLLQAAGGSELPARQRSLQAAFEYSWRLLDAEEQAALTGLAVFRGRFSRRAAERVAGAELPVLLSLVNKSLLRRVAGGRFELHQPTRQFALAKLEDAAPLRDAHAHYLAEVAANAETALRGPGQREWLDRINTERDDFLAAIDWCLTSNQPTLGLAIATSLQAFWWIRGPYRQGADLLLALTRLPSAAESPQLARGLHRAGTLVQELDSHEDVAGLYSRALTLAEEAGDKVLQADVIHSMGYRLDRLDRLEEAANKFRQAIELYREEGFLAGESASLNSLAVTLSRLDRDSEAEELFKLSLQQKRELGETQGEAYALHNLGVLYQKMGHREQGRRHVEASTALKRQIGDTRGVISALVNEANDHLEADDPVRASGVLLEVLADSWKLGLLGRQLQATLMLAAALQRSGRHEPAAVLLGALRRNPAMAELEWYQPGLLEEVSEAAEGELEPAHLDSLQREGSVLGTEQLYRLAWEQARQLAAATDPGHRTGQPG